MATAVMLCLRHVPCELMEDDFANIMIEFGLEVSNYKLCFPKRSTRQGLDKNFGYGFVTCRREEHADNFIRHLHNFQFDDRTSAERLRVERTASLQVDSQIGGTVEPCNLVEGECDVGSSESRDKDCNYAASLGASGS
eukprot:TRINITY_DN28878_c0_g1_i1.p1 TRINITY_DN28878_c0_g1~~TRINITY_DN28878_c0_g1_i1.p1  ORF type:complete len:138 (-),score=23.59 TRINITY_DN28878_c0_g1_i1:300-713(-)